MKKLLIFISIFISLVYLSSAINIVLTSWKKLDNNSWTNLSSVLNKVDVNSSDLKINWKLAVNWKICDTNDNCLWECSWWQIWDTSINSCKWVPVSCKAIYDDWERISWKYLIDSDWSWWRDAFEVYCDMTSQWWGWTRWYKSSNSVANKSDIENCVNNKFHFDESFECIDPSTMANSWSEFRLTRWADVQNPWYSDLRYDFWGEGVNWNKWWTFGSEIWTCWEFQYELWENGGLNNTARWKSSGGNFQTEIECYLR